MSSKRWVNSPRLHIHLIWLLEQLEPHQAALKKSLANGVTADFFCYSCGSTSTPPSVPRAVRDRAHALGFTIEIDHYNTSDATDVG
jgi:hypothetical protein